MVATKSPPDYELELNADGIIRDANTGEHFGHVPASLRSLYGAAPELLKALQDLLPHAEKDIERLNSLMVGNLYPSINADKIRRAKDAIYNATTYL